MTERSSCISSMWWPRCCRGGIFSFSKANSEWLSLRKYGRSWSRSWDSSWWLNRQLCTLGDGAKNLRHILFQSLQISWFLSFQLSCFTYFLLAFLCVYFGIRNREFLWVMNHLSGVIAFQFHHICLKLLSFGCFHIGFCLWLGSSLFTFLYLHL